jgi:hypothetical protein
MRKIILTALGSALVVVAVSNAASAAERRHVRNDAQQQTGGTNADPRGSFAEFNPGRAQFYGAYDSLPRGNASAAPAGR